MIDRVLLVLILIIISLLIMLGQLYSFWKYYADTFITVISITGSLLAIYDFISKKIDKDK